MLFWDVDTQVDFLTRDGRLYVPGAESILPNLARLTRRAKDRGWLLISSACAHRPGDPELRIYGPHCMAGTPGQQKVSETLLPHRYIVPNHRVELPPFEGLQQVIIEKQAFDPFTNPNTEDLLRKLSSPAQIVLYGVVTEICVAATARRLLEHGYQLALVSDAVFALDPAKATTFIKEFERSGGKVISTRDAVELEDRDVAA